MVRQQLFITAEQKRQIKTRAALTGASEGEIIRRGIDRELAQGTVAQDEGDWKEAWHQAFGMWKDRDDIEETIARRRRATRTRLERTRKLLRGE
jgi:hypothetical protein